MSWIRNTALQAYCEDRGRPSGRQTNEIEIQSINQLGTTFLEKLIKNCYWLQTNQTSNSSSKMLTSRISCSIHHPPYTYSITLSVMVPYCRFILHPFIQCCESMTFWGGSGSSDPCLWLMDPDPDSDPDSDSGSGSCYFRHWPSRCQQKLIF